jgi:succinoglycan biosynthesis transport protein ExoP
VTHGRDYSSPTEFRPIDLRRVVQPFVGRGWALAAATLLPVLVVWIASGYLPPSYRASSQILLEQEQVQLGKIADVMKAPLMPDSASISNEIAIILSTPVLQGAARRLGMLDSDLRPLGAAAEMPRQGAGWAPVEGLLGAAGFDASATTAAPIATETERLQGATRVTDSLRSALKVTRNLNALVIDVQASATDPVSAAAITNAVVEEYLARQGRVKRQVADQALSWMNGEITDLRRRISDLGLRAQQERRTLLSADAADPATTENQLRAVGAALAAARTERADSEARVKEIGLALDRIGVAAASELIETSEILNVRRQLADLEQRLAAERSSRGENRPIVSEMQAQIASLTEFGRTLVERELEQLDLDRRIKTERVANLQRESRELQRDSLSLEQAQVAIAAIEREAAANQELYVVLLTRLNEIAAQK